MSRRQFGSDTYLTSETYSWKMDAAAEMRDNQTPSERVIWVARTRIMAGHGQMVRQKLIRGYIVDFYLPSQRAIIEVDGRVHESDTQSARDEHRDQVFRDNDYSILRIEAAAAMRYPDATIDAAQDWVTDAYDEYGSRRARSGWIRQGIRGVRSRSTFRGSISHYPDGDTDLWHPEDDCPEFFPEECGGRAGVPSFWPLVVGA